MLLDTSKDIGNTKVGLSLVSITLSQDRRHIFPNVPSASASVTVSSPPPHGWRKIISCFSNKRYLCPQEPPAGLNTVAKCAHYVRLLPFLEDWQMFEGVEDMWCTSQQLLVRTTVGALRRIWYINPTQHSAYPNCTTCYIIVGMQQNLGMVLL